MRDLYSLVSAECHLSEIPVEYQIYDQERFYREGNSKTAAPLRIPKPYLAFLERMDWNLQDKSNPLNRQVVRLTKQLRKEMVKLLKNR